MLTPAPDYDGLVAAFRWRIPERYNIGVDVCDRWAAAEPERAAILEIGPDGRVAALTCGALRERSNRLANALRARGIGRGDRVAILLPQGAAVPIAHIAVYRLGAVALPLAALFGIDALAYRLADAGAKALVTNAAGLGKIQEIRSDLPALECVISTDGPDGSAEGFSRVLEAASPDFTRVDTAADGTVATLTYGALRDASNRFASTLRTRGVARGDRVAILLPQGAAVPIAHIAVYKLGAVALPLAALFGIDALA
ncbi:MAG: AMP-binding protein, partial [Microvirga sp.]